MLFFIPGHSGFLVNWNMLICVQISEASGLITSIHLPAIKTSTGQRRHIVTQCLTVAADPASLSDLMLVLIKIIDGLWIRQRVWGGGMNSLNGSNNIEYIKKCVHFNFVFHLMTALNSTTNYYKLSIHSLIVLYAFF